MIDKSTIDQCIRKERKALKLCYETCAPYVYTIVKNYIHNSNDYRDVMQEAFVSIYSSMSNYDISKGSFKSWMSTIVIRQCIAHIRKNSRIAIFYPAEVLETGIEITTELHRFSSEELNELLRHMPVGYRTIFLLSVVDEYTHKEIASMLNITAQTSRSQLSRALTWIRNNIKEEMKNYIYGTV